MRWEIPPEFLHAPVPIATPISRPFWDALAEDRVCIQRCAGCAAWVHYPRARCPVCLADALEWHAVSGRGTLLTWTVARRATAPMFRDAVPQRLAVVRLAEGVNLSTTLVDVDDDTALHADMAMEPVFEHRSDGATLLHYRPAGG